MTCRAGPQVAANNILWKLSKKTSQAPADSGYGSGSDLAIGNSKHSGLGSLSADDPEDARPAVRSGYCTGSIDFVPGPAHGWQLPGLATLKPLWDTEEPVQGCNSSAAGK